MKAIFGLGNPGEKYEKTRHNLGFEIVGQIAQKTGVDFRLNPDFFSETAEFGKDGVKVILVKPQTFMNESGRAVSKIKNYYRIEPNNLWIISDDVDLEFGKIKVNFGGSSAGHRGIQSIIDLVGEDFWKIRVGIGKSEKIPTEEWVLKRFEKENTEKLSKIIDKTSDLMIESVSQEITSQSIQI